MTVSEDSQGNLFAGAKNMLVSHQLHSHRRSQRRLPKTEEPKQLDSVTLGSHGGSFETAATIGMVTACGLVTGIAGAMLSGADQGMGTLMVIGGGFVGGIAGCTIAGTL